MATSKYRKLRPIASGGMATVFIGKTTGVNDFERVVAIKEMHPHIAKDQAYIDMFMDEARLAARIRHPNVVGVLDVQSPATGPFIVMEYVEGPTLSMLLKIARDAGEPIPIPVVLRILCDTLTGLHAAHDLRDKDDAPLQLVHRDVSPQNIMVGVDGITRITDFGVARARVRLATTRSGQLKGKLGYLPPEQIEGVDVDRRSDVYAAGVILWEALVGQRLFKAKTEAGLMMKLLSGADQSPREMNPKVPEAIDAVCMHALALAQEERPATAAELVIEIENAAKASNVPMASPREVASHIADLNIEFPALNDPSPASDPGVLGGDSVHPSDPHPSEPVRASRTETTSANDLLGLASSSSKSSRAMLALGLVALAVAIVVVIVSSSSSSTDAAPASSGAEQLDDIAKPAPTPSQTSPAPKASGVENVPEPSTTSTPKPGRTAPRARPTAVVPTPTKPTPGPKNKEYDPTTL